MDDKHCIPTHFSIQLDVSYASPQGYHPYIQEPWYIVLPSSCRAVSQAFTCSRSIDFGDVSQTNGLSAHLTRNNLTVAILRPRSWAIYDRKC